MVATPDVQGLVRLLVALLASAAVTSQAAAPAPSGQKLRYLVTSTAANDLDDLERDLLHAQLAWRLGQVVAAEVVDAWAKDGRLEAPLREHLLACDDLPCIAALAASGPYHFAVVPTLEQVGEVRTLTVTMLELRPAHVTGGGTISFAADDQVLLSMAARVAIDRAFGSPGELALVRRLEDSLVVAQPVDARPRLVVLVGEEPCTAAKPVGAFTTALVSELRELNILALPYSAAELARMSERELWKVALQAPAERAIFGRVGCSDTGAIMGTAMHSFRGAAAVQLVDLRSEQQLAAIHHTQALGHIDALAATSQVFAKLAEKVAESLRRQPGP